MPKSRPVVEKRVSECLLVFMKDFRFLIGSVCESDVLVLINWFYIWIQSKDELCLYRPCRKDIFVFSLDIFQWYFSHQWETSYLCHHLLTSQKGGNDLIFRSRTIFSADLRRAHNPVSLFSAASRRCNTRGCLLPVDSTFIEVLENWPRLTD